MDDQCSRRTLLRASAGTIGIGVLSGCAGSQSDTDQRVAELSDRVEELEAENERLRKRADAPSSSGEFSDEERSRAESVGQKAREGVVLITVNYGDGRRSSGTGWSYDSNHILTTAHGVDADGEMAAYTFYGDKIDVSPVSKTDFGEDRLDVALLETSSEAPTALSTASSRTLSSGQPVIQVGHPRFIGYWAVSLGTFVKRTSRGDLETELPHTGGNSGSPLLTLEGKVVGMTTGSRPIDRLRRPDTAPEPTNASLYEYYPYQEQIHAFQNPTEAIEQKVQSWLG